ncbi:ABC transporter permease [Sphaerisporangium siamense]|uniref:NitT/TauT family transport system permease protein n=1 Tax=Sphaerisporangium siamense TaxID=795645 RepID=A0A7W7D6Y2_9ACTN|nr:ABC transporter permease [Sphaerisporangium siamense]MBB4701417.1 NitT/TauT family transport system permease protein [Sphaerisporangium siamense]GII85540.1 ABC transporter permease [Sphaerisporangium siamense]
MTDLDSVAASLGTRPPAARRNAKGMDVPTPATAAPPEPGAREASEARRTARAAASRWAGTRARLGSAAKRSAALVVLVALWEFLPRSGLVDRVFVPPLSEDLAAGYELLRNGQLAEHLRASLIRSLAGFGLAIALAIPLGLAIGWYRPVAELLNPVLELFRNTSPVALLPVFALILGIGETNKIVFVLYACSWPILLNTIGGVRTVEPLLIKSARSMGLGPLRLFQKVILPAAVPTIFTGVRLAGAYSILVLLFAEMVGAKAGLGYLIQASQSNFRITDMYAGIITISALGLAFNQVLVVVERRFSTWRTT